VRELRAAGIGLALDVFRHYLFSRPVPEPQLARILESAEPLAARTPEPKPRPA
jgi:hypothetical protein